MSGRRALAAITTIAILVPVSAAHAAISGVSGNVVQVAPPASVRNGQTESVDGQAFDELQDVMLASDLTVDLTAPGLYDDATDLAPATIPAGTRIDSHLVHFDPPSSGPQRYLGGVSFHSEVLGVIVRRPSLFSSDHLGAPGTIYPFSGSVRELVLGPNETVELSGDRRTVSFDVTTKQGIDQIRVITAGNAAPRPDAGGPYSGVEGSPVTLAGTATDFEGDPLAYSWSFSWTGDPGTACTASDTNTLSPTLTCTDDALVTATLAADDGTDVATTDASVTIGNAAPSAGTVNVPSAVAPGDPVVASVAFGDAGTNDTHAGTVDWGDTTSSTASVSESGGSGTASATHAYSVAGVYTVTVTVSDDDGGVASASAQVVVNGAPTVDAGGPYAGDEGIPTGLAGTALDPDGDPLAVQWTFTPTAIDAGGTCATAGESTLTPTITCDDDAVVVADLEASDGINPPVVSQTQVVVANQAPVLGAANVTGGPIAVGAPVDVLAAFTDIGTNDTHSATVDWGDLTSSTATVTQGAGSGSLAASHAYGASGIYTVVVTLSDDDGAIDSATATVVVNSPPVADAGGDYAGSEGALLALGGYASDADGDALTVSWTFAVTGAPGVVCTPAGTGTLTPTLTCNDDATVLATLSVSDGVNPTVVDTATIHVGNVAPELAAAVVSASPVPTGGSVSVSAAFTDDGANDTHTATVDWGDGVIAAATVTESAGSGTVAGSHVYSAPGTYPIVVSLADDDGASVTATTEVVVNGAPEVGAGGPYSGVEGAGLVLNGTAVDPDADDLVVSWTRTIDVADLGTSCVFDDPSSLTPALTCDDDASVTVTLTADDGVNPPVTDSATVEILNAVPSLSAPHANPNPVLAGVSTTLSASFTDPGVNDTHVADIDWGDSTVEPAAVTESGGSGTVSGTHAYAAPGTYTATITVTDKDGGTANATATIVVNSAPEVDAGGPYAGTEGTAVTLNGAATDPDGDPLGISWAISWSADPGTACVLGAGMTFSPTVTCNDDAVVTATLTADDGISPPVSDVATVTIANVAPTAGVVSVPMTPVPVGTSVTATTTFADAGTNDTHTAAVDWGDGVSTAGTVSEIAGTGSVLAARTYTAAGTYRVAITVTDDDGGAVTVVSDAYVVVYDPSGGFVTGGGYIMSPSGAYTPDNPSDGDPVGKANYGFNSKYLSGATEPSGQTQFHMKSASFNFHSTGYAWLVVVEGKTRAYYRGTGKVNGVGGYEVLVSVVDGRSGNTGDKFRIKVWDPTTGVVVYDTDHGAADDAPATVGALGGNIVIH